MPGPFHTLTGSWKTLPAGVEWSLPDHEQGYMSFSVPIDIGGVTIGYFGLRGGCYADHPDRAVTLQLEVGSAAARTRIPLVRLDWKPLQETHKNPGRGIPPHAGRVIRGSHIHSFELNWLELEQRMRTGNLPFAEPLVPDAASYADFTDKAKILLRVDGIERLPVPEWAAKLL